MKKRKKSDPVVSEIERALDLGQFISYNRSWDFVRELEDSKKRIDALVKNGEAERAVGLYEMFFSRDVMKKQKKSTIPAVISACFLGSCSAPGSRPNRKPEARPMKPCSMSLNGWIMTTTVFVMILSRI
ncbi:MAG: hypothetical protein JRG74_08670 [Deltaproteobacteria bacterium]|nr:hypothetical protein [Deltaproteobacteria bacterium]MBW1834161.1 hypothetical protein [Deltaproteobacteria bacterium]MBW2166151.1 hypothetical protein [Deltaproteobacteria bacterium]